jgi:hypothetical protein
MGHVSFSKQEPFAVLEVNWLIGVFLVCLEKCVGAKSRVRVKGTLWLTEISNKRQARRNVAAPPLPVVTFEDALWAGVCTSREAALINGTPVVYAAAISSFEDCFCYQGSAP